MATSTVCHHPPFLLQLSDELLLHLCTFLDVPELFNLSRTCHHLRLISIDPILHHKRLFVITPLTLSRQLPLRPTLSTLHPPISTIYLTSVHLAARALSRALTALRLKTRLARRPTLTWLVLHNILPAECYTHDPQTGEVIYGGGLAPALVGVKRRIEKERVKDRLRRWVVGERRKVAAERAWMVVDDDDDVDVGGGKPGWDSRGSVRFLVQRFARRAAARAQQQSENNNNTLGRLGGPLVKKRDAPTRAHVLGLRRFWERVGREGKCRG